MARLPVYGGDIDNWGNILSEYLLVAHNSDGTLKSNSTVPDLFIPQDYGYVVGEDATVAIQACLDAASAVDGLVYLPAGTYIVNGALELYPHVSVKGAGNDSTIITQTATTGPTLRLAAFDDFPIRMTISDLRLVGPGQGSGDGEGILVGSLTDGAPAYGLTLKNVYITEFGGNGFHLDGNFMGIIEHCDAWNNGGYGFWLDGGTAAPTGTWQTSLALTACYANGNTGSGFRINKATYISLNSCAADNNAIGYDVYDASCAVFTACGAESPDDPARQISVGTQPIGFKVDGSSGLGSSNIVLVGCYVYSVTETAFLFAANAINCAMIGCRQLTAAGIDPITDYGINLGAGCYVTMVGNTIPDGTHVAAGGKVLQITAATAAGDAAGIFFGDTSPQLFPYTDSIQVNARGASQVPLVVNQFSAPSNADIARFMKDFGQHSVSISTYDGGQIKFGPSEDVKLTAKHQTSGNYYLGVDQPFALPVRASVSALNTDFPAGSYYGCGSYVDNGDGTMSHYISNGGAWVKAT